MQLNKSSGLTLLLAVCFALLQVLQPFIHAHLDQHSAHDSHSQQLHDSHQHDHHAYGHQQVGFHVADAHEEVFAQAVHDGTQLSAVPHASHTIFVAPAITKNVDLATVLNAMQLALYGLVMAIILLVTTQQFPALVNPHYPSIKRRLPATRAPPR